MGKSMYLPAAYETEVYVSESGFVCIRQEVDGEMDTVCLAPHQLQDVIKGLQRIRKELKG